MNLITDTWRQLVRRRLWPVALLLVAAAAAVPFLLGKTPEATPVAAAPATAAAASTDEAQTKPVVALVDDKQAPAKRRRVLGAQKDPFEPAPLPKPKKHKKAKAAVKKVSAEPTATPTPEASSDPAPTSDAPVTSPVAPVATPAPKTYPKGSLKIRFGKVDATKSTSTLERLKALPSANSPVLVYTGLEDHGKTAVFMLSGNVTAEGDGACEPAADSCETLKLRAGDTEFLTVAGTGSTDGQYELDLERINK